MAFSYNPNFLVHLIGQKTISEKPINVPIGKNRFFIKNQVKGLLIDIEGRIICYPQVKAGNYMLTIIIERGGKIFQSTNLVLFVRDPNDESLYNDDLSELTNKKDSKSTSDTSDSSVKKKKNKKKSSKKLVIKNSISESNFYTISNIKNNLSSFNNRTYGITIVVFSLLVALINSIGKSD